MKNESKTTVVWKRFQTSVVFKMFLNRIFIKKGQAHEDENPKSIKSCNTL